MDLVIPYGKHWRLLFLENYSWIMGLRKNMIQRHDASMLSQVHIYVESYWRLGKLHVYLLQFNNYTSFIYLIYMSGDRLHHPASANFINKWKSEQENVMSGLRSKSYLQCSLLQCHSQHSMSPNTTSSSMKGSLKVFTFHNSLCFNFPLSGRNHNFKPFYLFSPNFIVQWYKQTLKDLWKK